MRYEIKGAPFPTVICYMENGEQIVTEGGGMSWMSPNMEMQTTTNGGIGKALGRMFSRESMFQNIYTSVGGSGMISIGSSFPARSRRLRLSPAKRSSARRVRSLLQLPALRCPYISERNFQPAFSVARASSCRSSPATVFSSLR